MVKILVCDDQEMVCEGLRVILSAVADFQVVATAQDGEEAIEAAARFAPDVILMDLKMPRMNGVQAIRILRERYPRMRVLVLTTYDDDEWLFEALQSGAAGYLLKDTPRETLITAVRGTGESQTFIDPKVAGKVLERLARNPVHAEAGPAVNLTEREREVLGFITEGYSNLEIAAAMCLSEGTIRNYVSAVLAKLGVADRTQAAVSAIRRGML